MFHSVPPVPCIKMEHWNILIISKLCLIWMGGALCPKEWLKINLLLPPKYPLWELPKIIHKIHFPPCSWNNFFKEKFGLENS